MQVIDALGWFEEIMEDAEHKHWKVKIDDSLTDGQRLAHPTVWNRLAMFIFMWIPA